MAIGAGRCKAHADAARRDYEATRGTVAERGYGKAHRGRRIECFERDQWRCRKCGWEPRIVEEFRNQGLGLPPTETILAELRLAFARGERHLHADHRMTIEAHPELSESLGNYQTLCDRCHRIKTLDEGALGR